MLFCKTVAHPPQSLAFHDASNKYLTHGRLHVHENLAAPLFIVTLFLQPSISETVALNSAGHESTSLSTYSALHRTVNLHTHAEMRFTNTKVPTSHYGILRACYISMAALTQICHKLTPVNPHLLLPPTPLHLPLGTWLQLDT
jgi:hypothetical protein